MDWECIAMNKLNRQDLYSLEEYSEIRDEFRKKAMRHKQNRRINLGANATLYFEDRLTMQYQVQEMLRIERIFEAQGIDAELAAYNPLIPDGHNWKATFMLEYEDVSERRKALALLNGIEQHVWIKVGDLKKVYAICNEDLQRSTSDKTSAVHFMRFELDELMLSELKSAAPISMGIEHPNYHFSSEKLSAQSNAVLLADLDLA